VLEIAFLGMIMANLTRITGSLIILWGCAWSAAAAPVFKPEADTYGQGNNSGPYGSSTTLLVKYSDGTAVDWHRKVWIRYDATSRAGRALSNATLALPLVNSGFGSNATGNWQFEVYGLTDDSLDGWDEATAKWNDLPANITTSGNGIDTSKAVSLGTFTVSGTGVGTTPTISGPALTSFLASNANGLATFMVVRNTQAPDSGVNYAHAIASRETGTPATLSLVENNLLANGEFEDAVGNFSTTRWNNTNNVATTHSALIGGSAKAAYLDSTKDGVLEQTVAPVLNEWTFDTFFATENGGGGINDRGLNLMAYYTGGQLNLRVNGAGNVQMYQGSAWQTLTALNNTIAYSSDVNGDNDFLDAGDSLNVHHLRLIGHNFGTPNATYDVLLSDANQTALTHVATGLSFFQNGNPTGTNWNGSLRFSFETLYGAGDYAVDAAYAFSAPEPASLLLFGLGLGLVLAWRRRVRTG
jgi:hypothetical protein